MSKSASNSDNNDNNEIINSNLKKRKNENDNDDDDDSISNNDDTENNNIVEKTESNTFTKNMCKTMINGWKNHRHTKKIKKILYKIEQKEKNPEEEEVSSVSSFSSEHSSPRPSLKSNMNEKEENKNLNKEAEEEKSIENIDNDFVNKTKNNYSSSSTSSDEENEETCKHILKEETSEEIFDMSGEQMMKYCEKKIQIKNGKTIENKPNTVDTIVIGSECKIYQKNCYRLNYEHQFVCKCFEPCCEHLKGMREDKCLENLIELCLQNWTKLPIKKPKYAYIYEYRKLFKDILESDGLIAGGSIVYALNPDFVPINTIGDIDIFCNQFDFDKILKLITTFFGMTPLAQPGSLCDLR